MNNYSYLNTVENVQVEHHGIDEFAQVLDLYRYST